MESHDGSYRSWWGQRESTRLVSTELLTVADILRKPLCRHVEGFLLTFIVSTWAVFTVGSYLHALFSSSMTIKINRMVLLMTVNKARWITKPIPDSCCRLQQTKVLSPSNLSDFISFHFIPFSIRAVFGKDICRNAVHGASNLDKAGEVIEELFPEVELLPNGKVIGNSLVIIL